MGTSETPEMLTARRLRELRKERGLSLRRLAAACAAVGVKLEYRTLHDIEAGHRRVNLSDVTGLAFALNVSPHIMMMPTEDVDMQITSTISAPARDVLSWWLGYQPRPGVEPADDDARLAALVDYRRYLPYAGQHSRIQIETRNVSDLANEVSTPKDGQQR